MRKIYLLTILTLLSLQLTGCLVAESRYLQKVSEAETVTKERDELQMKLVSLQKEHDLLNQKYKELSKDRDTLAEEKNRLLKDKSELETLLKSKSDTLSKNITELRQKVAELEASNKKLNEEIVVLQKAKEEKVQQVSSTYEQLLQNMKHEIAQGQVTISELKGKLTVNMEAAILFDSGKSDVKKDGLAILMKMVDTLKNIKDKAIRIEGHTDNVQITGGLTAKFPTNWELSAARAINVTKYLQEQGIDPANLSAAAFSEYKPVADNSTKEGRSKNRRIEITLVAKD